MLTDRRTDPVEDLADGVTGILIGTSPVGSDVDSSVPVADWLDVISLVTQVVLRVPAREISRNRGGTPARKRRPG